MADLVLGSHPRFPTGSRKRGIARAVEIVEWAAAYADARRAECDAADRPLTASVFKDQAAHCRFIVGLLENER